MKLIYSNVRLQNIINIKYSLNAINDLELQCTCNEFHTYKKFEKHPNRIQIKYIILTAQVLNCQNFKGLV